MCIRKGIYLRNDDIGGSASLWLVYGAIMFTLGVLFSFYTPSCVEHVRAFREISHD